MLENIIKFLEENKDKKIALFSDMDGVIAQFEFDYNNDMISDHNGNYFLNKQPITTVIDFYKKLTEYQNLDFYILSACKYEHQADAKSKWLERFAPFFEKDKQIYVIKDITGYTKDNKAHIKTDFLVNIVNEYQYDYALYFEDEYLMLKKAHSRLKDKIICIHISNFLN